MKSLDAHQDWKRMAAEHREKGEDHQAMLAEYFAAAATWEPHASRHAPVSLQDGLSALDRP